MDTSTGFSFAAGSWIFHMQLSSAMRIKDANGEIGCSHSTHSANTFSSFTTHFPTFVQYNQWMHLACVFKLTAIDFAYNDLFYSHSVTLTTHVDPQTDNDYFSFGFPVSMPISFH